MELQASSQECLRVPRPRPASGLGCVLGRQVQTEYMFLLADSQMPMTHTVFPLPLIYLRDLSVLGSLS